MQDIITCSRLHTYSCCFSLLKSRWLAVGIGAFKSHRDSILACISEVMSSMKLWVGLMKIVRWFFRRHQMCFANVCAWLFECHHTWQVSSYLISTLYCFYKCSMAAMVMNVRICFYQPPTRIWCLVAPKGSLQLIRQEWHGSEKAISLSWYLTHG